MLQRLPGALPGQELLEEVPLEAAAGGPATLTAATPSLCAGTAAILHSLRRCHLLCWQICHVTLLQLHATLCLLSVAGV